MDALLSSNLEEAASGLLNLESTWSSIGKKSILLCLVSVPDPLYYLYSCDTGQEGQTLDRRAVTIFDTPQHLFCSSMHKYVCARTPEIFMVLFHVESRLKQTKYRVYSNS